MSNQVFDVKSRMGKGHCVTNICYNQSQLSLFEIAMAVVILCPIKFLMLHCLVHKAMDFPDLKNKCKQTAIFWVYWLFIHAEGEPDLFWLMSLTNQDMGLFTFLCSSYIEAQNSSWLTVMMRASVGCIVMQMFLYWKFEQALFCVEVFKHHRSVSFVFKHLRIDHFSVVKASSRFI